MKQTLATLSAVMVMAVAMPAFAEPLTINPDDTIVKLLSAQTGKTVTLKLSGSDELSGKVKSASAELVHLTELTGKEFFDAAVATKSIAAVVIRTK